MLKQLKITVKAHQNIIDKLNQKHEDNWEKRENDLQKQFDDKIERIKAINKADIYEQAADNRSKIDTIQLEHKAEIRRLKAEHAEHNIKLLREFEKERAELNRQIRDERNKSEKAVKEYEKETEKVLKLQDELREKKRQYTDAHHRVSKLNDKMSAAWESAQKEVSAIFDAKQTLKYQYRFVDESVVTEVVEN